MIERILRRGHDVEARAGARLEVRDEILLAGPSAAIVAAEPSIGHEIEGEHVMRHRKMPQRHGSGERGAREACRRGDHGANVNGPTTRGP
jgi:hypothetical protein